MIDLEAIRARNEECCEVCHFPFPAIGIWCHDHSLSHIVHASRADTLALLGEVERLRADNYACCVVLRVLRRGMNERP
jgi:hypothetical protein